MLENKRILIIVTGSIASYKSLYLIRLLKEAKAKVTVVMTNSAKKFITPLTFASLTENKVYQSLFDFTDEAEMGHIKLAKIHDLILVVPATANFISKIAGGIADDLASTILLATNSKVIFVPAMNVNMYKNIIIQDNINKLKKIGYTFLDGDAGSLACGDYGQGRMAEPEIVFVLIKKLFAKSLAFNGIEALVTAGPTHEHIDPVRFISNESSGIQGYMIAQELANNGAKVCLISGPTNLEKPSNICDFVDVKTAEEMYKACLKKIPKDLFISVAAVSDWKVETNKNKIKKNVKPPNFKLLSNPDILKSISHHKNRPKLVVGFSAETENLIKNSMLKLRNKKCDIIVANNVSKKNNVFGSNMNSVNILYKDGSHKKFSKMSKKTLAKKLLSEAIYPFLN